MERLQKKISSYATWSSFFCTKNLKINPEKFTGFLPNYTVFMSNCKKDPNIWNSITRQFMFIVHSNDTTSSIQLQASTLGSNAFKYDTALSQCVTFVMLHVTTWLSISFSSWSWFLVLSHTQCVCANKCQRWWIHE